MDNWIPLVLLLLAPIWVFAGYTIGQSKELQRSLKTQRELNQKWESVVAKWESVAGEFEKAAKRNEASAIEAQRSAREAIALRIQ